ncbi:sodium:proton exchanger [bacterium]|nr:sodium:proton exchanger [bacterium]
MHNLELILTLTYGLAVALFLGYTAFRLRLSPIVGYLLAGFLLGPFTPGFVGDQHIAEQFAEVGVILLMFGVGLQFHLEELIQVRGIAIPGALGQISAATVLGVAVGYVSGMGWAGGLVFGLAISVASTVVLLRVLADNNDLHTPGGHIAVGWLVVEDLFTVLVLVMLPAIFEHQGSDPTAIALSLLWSILKLGLLVVFTFVAGQRIVPWILSQVAMTRSRELFTLAILVIALGIAVGSAELFGASMALGAFLAGMVVGRSEFSLRAATDALPMRDAFAVLFFVSIGMLFDPSMLLAAPGLFLATLGIVVLGKPLSAIVIILALKYPLRIALMVAVALAQIGEFTFIVATLGERLELLGERATSALVAAAIVSISINPLLYRRIDWLEKLMLKIPMIERWNATVLARRGTLALHPAKDDANPSVEHTAIVIGYGPVGRTVVRLLRNNAVVPTVIELNLETVRQLREANIPVVYGDATLRPTLEAAGVTHAVALVLGAAGMTGSTEIIRLAREMNPKIRILARTAYLHEVFPLQASGADVVFSGEGEIAMGMTELILRHLGATAEQIDRERDRIRQDFLGGSPTSALFERLLNGRSPTPPTTDSGTPSSHSDPNPPSQPAGEEATEKS